MDGGIASSTVARIWQVPLALAFASTIHRAQGQQQDTVDVETTGCFVAGQVYTTLSRCRRRDGLTMDTLPVVNGTLKGDKKVRRSSNVVVVWSLLQAYCCSSSHNPSYASSFLMISSV
jgi:ATP-dependent exoDNAse (exonuclease V) alpha subunit